MPQYSFVTVWKLEAPIEAVWEAIKASEKWPSWWKYVTKVVELKKGDEDGVGGVRRYTWASPLPYKLTFETRVSEVDEPHVLVGIATGELSGTGRWQLSQEGAITTIQYNWDVATNKRILNLLAPIARPIFSWNHNIVMKAGGEGLARLLNARLISNESA
ncbi:MAG TPA: SRPBCC family protein [Chloroflexia bacterium]|nr:SRPBCC family protein [Chloroflexia bacterium]